MDENQANPRVKKLSEEDYAEMRDAAHERHEDCQWNHIFPDGEDDITLPLSLAEQSSSTIEAQILQLYRDAETEKATRLNRPLTIPPISLSEDAKRIVHADSGETLVKVGKFLEKQDAWALQDDWMRMIAVQAPEETVHAQQSSARKADLAHDQYVASDGFDPSSLRVIISRDPDKIAEMSTGQRWTSCMAKGREHNDFVAEDIREGTLVAYVIAEDDTRAEYPLMRQLLKPYLNEKGEQVLVPAKIYGGDGKDNANTRLRFKETCHDFVQQQHNADKTGKFRMNTNLYLDGEAASVLLGRAWNKEMVDTSLAEFIVGALTEYRTEQYRARQHGHLKDEAKYTKRIQNLLDPEQLARDFFRATRRSSLDGNLPTPAQCREGAQTYLKEHVTDSIKLEVALYTGNKALVDETIAAWKDDALALRNCLLNDTETKMLADALATAPQITSLDLSANKMTHLGAKALSQLEHLQTLDIGNNAIGDKGARCIATLPNLRQLKVRIANIQKEGAEAFADQASLRELDIGYNLIGDEACEALLKTDQFEILDIPACNAGSLSAAAAAKTTRLTSLNISSHENISAHAEADILKNGTIGHINMTERNTFQTLSAEQTEEIIASNHSTVSYYGRFRLPLQRYMLSRNNDRAHTLARMIDAADNMEALKTSLSEDELNEIAQMRNGIIYVASNNNEISDLREKLDALLPRAEIDSATIDAAEQLIEEHDRAKTRVS